MTQQEFLLSNSYVLKYELTDSDSVEEPLVFYGYLPLEIKPEFPSLKDKIKHWISKLNFFPIDYFVYIKINIKDYMPGRYPKPISPTLKRINDVTLQKLILFKSRKMPVPKDLDIYEKDDLIKLRADNLMNFMNAKQKLNIKEDIAQNTKLDISILTYMEVCEELKRELEII